MAKEFKPTKEQLQAAAGTTIPDVLAPGMRLILCGINPSLYSAAVEHHFARPGNRFWPALHRAGITPRLYSPFEDASLAELGLGLTNMVARATARADELSSEELIEGKAILENKLRKYKPKHIAFLGVTAYRSAFEEPKAQMGLQEEKWANVSVWILPNPSGLNAHYQLDDFAELFRELWRQTEAKD